MGVTAYNRGNEVVRRKIQEDFPQPSRCTQIINRINSLEKTGKFEPLFDFGFIQFDKGVWFLSDYNDPYGSCRWYPTLDTLVKSWKIYLIDYRDGVWISVSESAMHKAQDFLDRLT